MADKDPCAGHQCDNCVICRKGKCCRRDRPGYRLPELGEWSGHIYGELGVLSDDGEKAQCHCCGEMYGHLGGHISRRHDLTPDEYKAIFGLAQGTGLIGPKLAAHRRANAEHLVPYHELAAKMLSGLTPEQRVANRKKFAGRPGQYVQRRTAHAEKLKQQAESARRFREDPEVREAWKRKIAAGHIAWSTENGHRPLSTECVICGAVFQANRTVIEKGNRTTCGKPECIRERQRRRMLADPISKRPEVRQKMSAKAKERAKGIVRDAKGRIVSCQSDT